MGVAAEPKGSLYRQTAFPSAAPVQVSAWSHVQSKE